MWSMIAFKCVVVLFFFFKQKTAYEMRISDWSSDVCSSDLAVERDSGAGITGLGHTDGQRVRTGATIDDIGIGQRREPVDHVVARAGIDRLVARRSRVVQPDHVVARTGVDNIVAAAGLEDVSEGGTSEGIVAVGPDHGSAIMREVD